MSKALVLDVVDVRPQLYCAEARLLKTDANTPSKGESCTDRLASDLFSNLTCLTCLNEPARRQHDVNREPGRDVVPRLAGNGATCVYRAGLSSVLNWVTRCGTGNCA
jgi:hypothetical protein